MRVKWGYKKRTKIQKEMYYISKGVEVRVFDSTNFDSINNYRLYTLRKDLAFDKTQELKGPVGWRTFKVNDKYTIQVLEQYLLSGPYWDDLYRGEK